MVKEIKVVRKSYEILETQIIFKCVPQGDRPTFDRVDREVPSPWQVLRKRAI